MADHGERRGNLPKELTDLMAQTMRYPGDLAEMSSASPDVDEDEELDGPKPISADTQIQYRQEIRRLKAALRDAIGCVEEWSAYADEYYRQKHDLAGDLERLRKALREGE